MPDSNLLLLEEAAVRLGPLLDEVVFVGGATLSLLITDPGAAPARATIDVDVIARIATYGEYNDFSERLRVRGFVEDTRENAPVCRWIHGGLTLDAMPVEEILGFSNRWYRSAFDAARQVVLPSGSRIRAITAPYFLGSKVEAFRSRANGTSMPVTIWKILSPSSMVANRSARRSLPRPPVCATTWPMRQANC